MSRFTIERGQHAGHEAIHLVDRAAELRATFLPALGMVGASLVHRGAELLGRTDNLERWAREGSTMGIPLLHPWANRIAGLAYTAGGTSVVLDPGSPLLHDDGNGLLIHGIAATRLPWRVDGADAGPDGAQLVAHAAFAEPELLEVFPFAHRLGQAVRLADDGLTITTSLSPVAAAAVPVAFGYHPYFQLPGVPRAELRVELPPLRRLLLDERWVPTGATEAYAGLAGSLDRGYDDGFADVADGTAFVLASGGRRVTVTFLRGYPFAQVYAPEGHDFVSFEPMTAPANALVSGDGLRLAVPGETIEAAFRIAATAGDQAPEA